MRKTRTHDNSTDFETIAGHSAVAGGAFDALLPVFKNGVSALFNR